MKDKKGGGNLERNGIIITRPSFLLLSIDFFIVPRASTFLPTSFRGKRIKTISKSRTKYRRQGDKFTFAVPTIYCESCVASIIQSISNSLYLSLCEERLIIARSPVLPY